MVWQKDLKLQRRLNEIVRKLNFLHIRPKMVFVFRSFGSKSRAQARIWGFPRIWQQALDSQPAYCLEVLSEKFDRLDEVQQTKVLIHELMHIPKNFSGSLLAHRGRSGQINARTVEKLYERFIN
jgi:predicted metallopeptidase